MSARDWHNFNPDETVEITVAEKMRWESIESVAALMLEDLSPSSPEYTALKRALAQTNKGR